MVTFLFIAKNASKNWNITFPEINEVLTDDDAKNAVTFNTFLLTLSAH